MTLKLITNSKPHFNSKLKAVNMIDSNDRSRNEKNQIMIVSAHSLTDRRGKIKMERNDKQPTVRVETKDGAVFYPKFKKSTNDVWSLKDKSFQDMLIPKQESKQNGKKDVG